MPVRQRPTRQEVGKRDRRSLMAAAGTTSFFIKDDHSGTKFLVDTGAQRSILPATSWDKRGGRGEGLKAANQTTIATYGTRMVMLKFGDTLYEHEFTIADLPHRFLGMDFFENNNISIDTKKRELFKRGDGATICAVTSTEDQDPVQAQPKDVRRGRPELFELLDSFPDVLTPNFHSCLLYTSPSPRDKRQSRMPSSA